MILSILVKIDAVTPVTQPGWMLRASPGELPETTAGGFASGASARHPVWLRPERLAVTASFAREKLSATTDQVIPPKVTKK